MDGRAIQRAAAARAEELPGAELTHPFGPEWDVWKVRGKVFMLLTDLRADPIVTLKTHPDDGIALRSMHGAISAGYHMNKRHWISVRPGTGVDGDLVTDLVTESYRLVVAGLPRRVRPVDPELFGRR